MSSGIPSRPRRKATTKSKAARLDLYKPWQDFLDEIRRARKQVGNPKVAWYRGHSNFEYKLVPSLLRYTNDIEKEKELFHKFKNFAWRVMPKRDNDWETLFDMQHYYVPTRLLDWSEHLGAAVFFAILKATDDADAAVFVLNPFKLNEWALGRKEIKRIDKDFQYQQVYWKRDPISIKLPVALEPPFQNERMLAQRGTFTIHGWENKPIEDQCPENCVKKVRLKKEAIIGAKEFLEFANINEFSIFPDIVGLAPFIKEIVKLS